MMFLRRIFMKVPGVVYILLLIGVGTAIVLKVSGGFSLANPTAIMGLVLLLITAFGIFGLMFTAKRKSGSKRGKELEGGMLRQHDRMVEREAEEEKARLGALRDQWDEARRFLHKSSINEYALPWFAIIGAPGCGKSTSLRHSGIDFPFNKLTGLGGTRNCDFWFSNEAVVLDTAGRLTVAEADAVDHSEWEEFLKLLKKARPNYPINGVIIAIPADSLLTESEEQHETTARQIKEKLDQFASVLDFRLPLYILLTKCDKIRGFADFFSEMSRDQQRQLIGWSHSADPGQPMTEEQFEDAFEELVQKLTAYRPTALKKAYEVVQDSRPVERALAFPDALRSIGPGLLTYLSVFSQGSIFQASHFFRGFYLSSGVQELGVMEAMKMKRKRGVKIKEHAGKKRKGEEGAASLERGLFIRDFYGKVFQERTLARPFQKAVDRQRIVAQVCWGIGTVIVALLGILWTIGAVGESKSVNALTASLTELDKEGVDQAVLSDVLRLADRVDENGSSLLSGLRDPISGREAAVLAAKTKIGVGAIERLDVDAAARRDALKPWRSVPEPPADPAIPNELVSNACDASSAAAGLGTELDAMGRPDELEKRESVRAINKLKEQDRETLTGRPIGPTHWTEVAGWALGPMDREATKKERDRGAAAATAYQAVHDETQALLNTWRAAIRTVDGVQGATPELALEFDSRCSDFRVLLSRNGSLEKDLDDWQRNADALIEAAEAFNVRAGYQNGVVAALRRLEAGCADDASRASGGDVAGTIELMPDNVIALHKRLLGLIRQWLDLRKEITGGATGAQENLFSELDRLSYPAGVVPQLPEAKIKAARDEARAIQKQLEGMPNAEPYNCQREIVKYIAVSAAAIAEDAPTELWLSAFRGLEQQNRPSLALLTADDVVTRANRWQAWRLAVFNKARIESPSDRDMVDRIWLHCLQELTAHASEVDGKFRTVAEGYLQDRSQTGDLEEWLAATRATLQTGITEIANFEASGTTVAGQYGPFWQKSVDRKEFYFGGYPMTLPSVLATGRARMLQYKDEVSGVGGGGAGGDAEQSLSTLGGLWGVLKSGEVQQRSFKFMFTDPSGGHYLNKGSIQALELPTNLIAWEERAQSALSADLDNAIRRAWAAFGANNPLKRRYPFSTSVKEELDFKQLSQVTQYDPMDVLTRIAGDRPALQKYAISNILRSEADWRSYREFLETWQRFGLEVDGGSSGVVTVVLKRCQPEVQGDVIDIVFPTVKVRSEGTESVVIVQDREVSLNWTGSADGEFKLTVEYGKAGVFETAVRGVWWPVRLSNDRIQPGAAIDLLPENRSTGKRLQVRLEVTVVTANGARLPSTDIPYPEAR